MCSFFLFYAPLNLPGLDTPPNPHFLFSPPNPPERGTYPSLPPIYILPRPPSQPSPKGEGAKSCPVLKQVDKIYEKYLLETE